jgi:hypothetical protein
MDFGKAFQRGLGIVQLKADVIQDTAGDSTALVPGVIILAIAGVLSGLPAFPIGIIAVPVVFLIVAAIIVGIVHLVAKLIGGQGTYGALFQVYGHGNGLIGWTGVLAIIPILGQLIGLAAGIWGVIVMIVSVREVHRMSTGKAVAAVLIPIVVLIVVCGGIIAVVGLGAFMAVMENQQ